MGLRRSHLIAILGAALALCVVSAVLVTLVVRHAAAPLDKTEMTLNATGANGARPQPAELTRSREILLARLKAAGYSDATVALEDGQRLLVEVPGRPPADRLRDLTARGEL